MSAVLDLYRYLSANGEIKQLEVYRMQMVVGQFKPFLYELIKHKTQVMSSIFKKPIVSEPVRAITRKEYNIIFQACVNNRDKLLIALRQSIKHNSFGFVSCVLYCLLYGITDLVNCLAGKHIK